MADDKAENRLVLETIIVQLGRLKMQVSSIDAEMLVYLLDMAEVEAQRLLAETSQ